LARDGGKCHVFAIKEPDMIRPIVVIDDHPEHLEFIVTLLRRAGFSAQGFASAKRAVEFIARSNTAVVVTDVFMPDMDGFEVMQCIRRDYPGIAVIGIGGSRKTYGSSLLKAMGELGAAAIFEKPIDPVSLIAEVGCLLKQISVPPKSGAETTGDATCTCAPAREQS
jgi:DNA-binding NtrC family response regulator